MSESRVSESGAPRPESGAPQDAAASPATVPPAPVPPGTVPPALRRARFAVAVLFFTNGAIFANLLPEYPAIKSGLDLTNARFGVAVAAFPAGALLAGLAAGVLIRRFRSSCVAVAGTLLTGVGVFVAGGAGSWALLALGLLVAGAMDAITDVAQNAHGLRVQRRYGRSILNSFHAVWSIGAVTGGLMGAAAVASGMSVRWHLGISAALFTLLALGSLRYLLPGPEGSDQAEPEHAQPRGTAVPAAAWARVVTLGALVVIAASGSVVEDSGSSWAALYLHDDLGASLSLAAFGFVALTGAQFVGRLIGDRMVDRFGQRAVARAGGVLVTVGMGLALAFPSVPGTIAGFALAGFGVATLVPAAMHGADMIPGLKPGTGLAVLGWLMRLGFLLSPPVVGLISDATSLRVALLVVPLAGLAVVLAAGVLAGRREVFRRQVRA